MTSPSRTVALLDETGQNAKLYVHRGGPGRSEKALLCEAPCRAPLDADGDLRFSVEVDEETIGDRFLLSGGAPDRTVRVRSQPSPSRSMQVAGGILTGAGGLAAVVGAITLGVGVDDAKRYGETRGCLLFCLDPDILIGTGVLVGGATMLGAGLPLLIHGYRRTRPVLDLPASGAFAPRFAGLALTPPLSLRGAEIPATAVAAWTF